MAWFNVDDGVASSRKFLAIPKKKRAEAAGAWMFSGAWCQKELTEGFIPRYALDEIPSGPQMAPILVSVGLWHEATNDAGDQGFQFHNWLPRNKSKAQVLAERERHAKAQERYRKKRHETVSDSEVIEQ